jgi:hypothetical protein
MRMRIHRLLPVVVICSALVLVAMPGHAAAAAAAPRLSAAPTLANASGGVRITVVVTGSRTLSARQRPRSVKARVGTVTYTLTRQLQPVMTGRRGGTWRSTILRGAAATRARNAVGAALPVTIVDVAGKTVTVRPILRRPATTTDPGGTTEPGGTDPGGTTPTPLFPVPAGPLEGNAAVDHIDEYFLNARFTNCVEGWPNCPTTAPVVERYVHCPDGGWQYHRESSVQGADIHSYYTFTITGATVFADGSWAVSYTTSTGGNYVWQVSTNGSVSGVYQFGNDNPENLGPFVWASTGC